MKISFAICVHDEGHYIENLLRRLTSFINDDRSGVQYEIVIIDDFSTDELTVKTLQQYVDNPLVFIYQHALDGDYGRQKTFMNSKCKGDWILNLDADEFVTDDFLAFIPHLVDMNPGIDAYWVPRINTVDGITLKHVQKWGWVLTKFEDMRTINTLDINGEFYQLLKQYQFIIDERRVLDPNSMIQRSVVTYYEPIIAWPDFQMRLYKNSPKIYWARKVHETLTGFDRFGMLPQDTFYAIRHFKTIKRQESQMEYYDTLQS